ncbi:MAG TPA: hypothetical protein VEP49_08915 [Acidimicrobiia bacterium]|nr:hypothetical protein [Acidimicrobiia bacterium]
MRSDNELNNELLQAELPNPRLVDTAYIEWLYDQSPYGPSVQRNADDEGIRVAHYAMIPQRYRGPDGVVPAGFSLNAVVRTGAQRKGWFRTLGPEVYEGARAAGWRFATGVCNDKSIGTVIKYLEWKSPGPLPVRVCPPSLRAGNVESHHVDDEFFAGSFEHLAAGLDASPVRAWTNSYTPEYLRWRLASPHVSYAVHANDEVLGVSTVDKRFGVRAAVVLKLLPRDGRSGPIRGEPIVTAACRFHRAPYAVYAGFNEHVKVRGIRPPRRLQPSPLHLILKSLCDDIDQETLTVDTFEFLDMDAY